MKAAKFKISVNPDVSLFQGERLFVDTTIINTGASEAEFEYWSCGWEWEWAIDNPNVLLLGSAGILPPYFLRTCFSRVHRIIVLKPQEAFDFSEMELMVSEKCPLGKQKFRLQYRDIWSNEVVINVVKGTEEQRKAQQMKRDAYEKEQEKRDDASQPKGVVKTFYESGELYFERSVKNGKWNGPYKLYYRNGQLEEEGNHLDNMADGKTRFYDKYGHLKEEKIYIKGNEILQCR